MTGEQIKLRIEELNSQIREMVMPNFFTLNKKVTSLMNEIKELQSNCPHQFDNGYCQFCGIKEEDN